MKSSTLLKINRGSSTRECSSMTLRFSGERIAALTKKARDTRPSNAGHSRSTWRSPSDKASSRSTSSLLKLCLGTRTLNLLGSSTSLPNTKRSTDSPNFEHNLLLISILCPSLLNKIIYFTSFLTIHPFIVVHTSSRPIDGLTPLWGSYETSPVMENSLIGGNNKATTTTHLSRHPDDGELPTRRQWQGDYNIHPHDL